ncbi:MAG: hypothetical protein Q4F71_10115 [Paracoccus sp. (in: a-proteobacteria)]|nr:hypothetical protein [Paracoccus sp. (in: a-proteobacteria)]
MPLEPRPDRPLFLERAAYRRRRLRDAARVLPAVSLLLCVVPVIWTPKAMSFAGGAIWFFAVWLAIVVLSGVLHLALGRQRGAERSDEL